MSMSETSEVTLEAQVELDYVALTTDLLFHLVFTKNEKARISLISSLLNIPETEILSADVLNPLQWNESIDTKTTVLDLKVHLNHDRYILIEMQVRRFDYWTSRTLIYGCREIDEQTRGTDFTYGKLQPVIQIAIMDHTLFQEHRKFFARYRIQDEADGYLFSDKLQFYVLDLTAINEASEEAKKNGLVDWARAFSANDWKTVETIDNAGVKEATKTMETIMSSPEQRQRILNRRKAQLDEKSLLEEAEARGEAKGEIYGALNTLANLVKKKLLSLSDAAGQMGMTEKEFAAKTNLGQ